MEKNHHAKTLAISAILVLAFIFAVGQQRALALSYTVFAPDELTGIQLSRVQRSGHYLYIGYTGTPNHLWAYDALTLQYIDDVTVSIQSNFIPRFDSDGHDAIIFASDGFIKKYAVDPSDNTLKSFGTAHPCNVVSPQLSDDNFVNYIIGTCNNDDRLFYVDPDTMGYDFSPIISVGTYGNCQDPRGINTDHSNTPVVLVSCHGASSKIVMYNFNSSFPSFDNMYLVDSLAITGDKYLWISSPDNENDFWLGIYGSFDSTGIKIIDTANFTDLTLQDTFNTGLHNSNTILTCSDDGLFIHPNCADDTIMIVGDMATDTLQLYYGNKTLAGSIDCSADCNISFTTPIAMDSEDANTYYVAGSNGNGAGKIIIFNTTSVTHSVFDCNELPQGCTGGGGNTNNTDDDDGNTIIDHGNQWWCLLNITDNCTDIKTDGLGFLILILMLALLLIFFGWITKWQYEKIHPIIWVGGFLAVFALAVGIQIIEPYWLLLAIVLIIVFASYKIWMPLAKGAFVNS